MPDPAALEPWEIDPERTLVVLRPPPDVSLYHRHANPLFPLTLEHLGRLDDVHAFVLPRTEEQREYVRSLALPSVIVPEQAVDAQSLIAFADLVVSAGGTMNREAAALGVPGLHDLRRPARRRRRGADPAGPAAAAHRPARARPREARARRRRRASRCGATRSCCSTLLALGSRAP